MAVFAKSFPLTLLSVVLLAMVFSNYQATVEAQCGTLQNHYDISSLIDFNNVSSQVTCHFIAPQPSDHTKEVKSISWQLDPNYTFAFGVELLIFNATQPMYGFADWTVVSYVASDAGNINMTINSPYIMLVLNTTSANGLTPIPFYFKWTSTGTRTKFGLALFEAVLVAIGAPFVSLLISIFTFRKGCFGKLTSKHRLNRYTPIGEQIMTWIFVGVGGLFFFLLLARVMN